MILYQGHTFRRVLYAWLGSVNFIPFNSKNLNCGMIPSSAAVSSTRMTSWTVAVFPVPGTPDIYIHLKKVN